MEITKETPHLQDPSEYERLKTYVLRPNEPEKPSAKGLITRLKDFLKSLIVTEAPDEGPSTLSQTGILPKEDEYPDPTAKK